MANKILVICGPTATGKTKLALSLAKILTPRKEKDWTGELVSADSRQVYQDLDIGTGKDIPRGAIFKYPDSNKSSRLGGYYQTKGTRIWGYDLVGPKQEFSVAHYVKIASKIVKNIRSRKKLPILVGGTGLYIKAVIDGIPTITIPKNRSLRKSLDKKKRSDLYEMLAKIDPVKAASMNYSDKRNPRRLIRAIEVAQWKLKNKPKKSKSVDYSSLLVIGLEMKRDSLAKKIGKRVKVRLKKGLEEEIGELLKNGVKWTHQSMDSLGYKQWKSYFKKHFNNKLPKSEKKKDRQEVVEKWIKEEVKYSKKQMTWFRRDKRIKWFNIEKRGWQRDVVKLAKEWYKGEEI